MNYEIIDVISFPAFYAGWLCAVSALAIIKQSSTNQVSARIII